MLSHNVKEMRTIVIRDFRGVKQFDEVGRYSESVDVIQ